MTGFMRMSLGTMVLALSMVVVSACGTKTADTNAPNEKAESVEQNTNNAANAVDNKDATHNVNANAAHEYNYQNGVLNVIVDDKGNPKQSEFVIDGVILVGNRHRYLGTDDTDGALLSFVKQGYLKSGINADFYLNEYIGFYIDTKYAGDVENVKILVTPHKTVEAYEKMSSSDLTSLAEEKGFVLNYQTPDAEQHKYVGEGYVNIDYPEGQYDILFMYKGKLAYYINISETKEPNAE